MSHQLNHAQLTAVQYINGPCLVLAGAGSGKTRVITQKIAYLIERGLAAENIAAITFTNKAAAEMRERSRNLIGRTAGKVLINTFHSLGVKILRQDGELLGLKQQFSILDSDDGLALLKDAGNTSDLSTVRLWQWQISGWKNAGIDAQQALARAKSESERQTALIFQRYQERLAAYQSVDFDDLIQLPLRLLQQHPEVRAAWQRRLRHVLVDEYQDTNATQYQLLKLLVGEQPAFTVVGDDDQSIYGWRGATLENLKQLPLDFPQLNIIKLEQNYRSTSAILRAANNVISANPKLFPKKLWSDLGEGENIKVISTDQEEHEAECAVHRIKTMFNKQAGKWKDFAILYRANHQAKYLERALRKAKIPYKVSGGQSIFDKAEIKDLCAWFRIIINPKDDPAFLRAITHPKRGVGHSTLQTLSNYASSHKYSLLETLASSSLNSCIPTRTLHSLHEFGRLIDSIVEQLTQVNTPEKAKQFFNAWLEDIGYETHLYRLEDNENIAAARWENVLEFCDWAAQRLAATDDNQAESTNLWQVLQTIALISSLKEKEQEQDEITLSTLHAAKGLEWPHVVLVGVNEDLLPFRVDRDADAAAETLMQRIFEERRLMYVGITRAQRSLMISWLKRRKKGRETVAGRPSRFIAEMQLEETASKQDTLTKLQQLRASLLAKAKADN